MLFFRKNTIKNIVLLGSRYQNRPLDNVIGELNELRKVFLTTDVKALYEPYLNKEILTSFLQNHKDKINIFHFSGHADFDNFQTDEDKIYIERFAEILKTWNKKPEIFFINGCNSLEHAKWLLEAGVLFVIVTNNFVDDVKAKKFALEFYRNLISGHDIKSAASNAHHALNLDKKKNKSSRSIELQHNDLNEEWQVFSKSKKSQAFSFFYKGKERVTGALFLLFFLTSLSIAFHFSKNYNTPPYVENSISSYKGKLDFGFFFRMLKDHHGAECSGFSPLRRLIYGTCKKLNIDQELYSLLVCENNNFYVSNVTITDALRKANHRYGNCFSINVTDDEIEVKAKLGNYQVINGNGKDTYHCHCI